MSCFLACSLQPCGHLLGRAGLLALMFVMFHHVCFVTFPCGVLGQVLYLIVSIPDICLFTYFKCTSYSIIGGYASGKDCIHFSTFTGSS